MTPTRAEVTVVLTCMTDAERPFLAAALRSVLGQRVPVAEVLVCVEGSNAWAAEVVAPLAEGVAVPVTLLRLALAPPGLVRNQALSRVTTPVVAFLDGDDEWHHDKLRRQLDALHGERLDVVASRHVLIREDGKRYFFGFAADVPMQSSWLARTDALRQRPYPPLDVGEDVALWRRVQEELRWRVLPDYLLRYRVRASSQSSTTWSKERKLRFARRSHTPGARPALLAASYGAGVLISARARVRARRALTEVSAG